MRAQRSPFQYGLAFSLTLVLILSLSIALARTRAAANAADGPTTVGLTGPGAAGLGRVTIKLVVNNAHDLAGFQGIIRYDPAQMSLSETRFAQELGRSGRTLLAFGSVEQPDAVVLGAATCPTDPCGNALRPFAVRHLQGVYGRVELAEVEFVIKSPGQHTLALEGVQLVDPQGNLLAMQVFPSLTLAIAGP